MWSLGVLPEQVAESLSKSVLFVVAVFVVVEAVET